MAGSRRAGGDKRSAVGVDTATCYCAAGSRVGKTWEILLRTSR